MRSLKACSVDRLRSTESEEVPDQPEEPGARSQRARAAVLSVMASNGTLSLSLHSAAGTLKLDVAVSPATPK